MTTRAFNTTLLFYPAKSPRLRLFALWYFTTLMIVWNVVGHTVLGFEQSWAAPLVAVFTAIAVSMLLDWVDARARDRELRFTGSLGAFLNFLPACLIPGFACAMLLYTNERLSPLVFAVVLSIGSKLIFRAPVGEGRTQHFFNPSNLGVGATLLLFPEVSFAPPYHFTENLSPAGSWILPAIIVASGTFLNARFTRRIPVVAGWIGGFVLQAALRSAIGGTPLAAALAPMTGVAFVLFTFYMVTDPATTPERPVAQATFGASVALAYGLLVVFHIVFDLFFSLSIVCVARWMLLVQAALAARRRTVLAPVPTGAATEP